jgi:hypothetical protein
MIPLYAGKPTDITDGESESERMPTDRLKAVFDDVRGRWRALERDWQSVAVGTAIVGAIAAFEIPIPW